MSDEVRKMRKDGSVTESKIMELRTKMDKLLNENLSRLDKDFTKFARGISKVKDYIFTFLEDYGNSKFDAILAMYN